MPNLSKSKYKCNGGKLSNLVMIKVRANLTKYNLYKKITANQNKADAVDTSRYYASMKWYEVIRSTFEEWRECYPNDAAVIADIYKIGSTTARTLRVDGIALKHHYSVSSLYNVKRSFELEIAFKAIKNNLISL